MQESEQASATQSCLLRGMSEDHEMPNADLSAQEDDALPHEKAERVPGQVLRPMEGVGQHAVRALLGQTRHLAASSKGSYLGARTGCDWATSGEESCSSWKEA